MIDSATIALALAIALGVLVPLLGALEHRFVRSSPDTQRKLTYYAISIVSSWALTVAAVLIFGVDRLGAFASPWAAWLPFASITGPLILILLAVYFLLGLMPLIHSLRGPRWRRAAAKAYRRHAEDFPGFLPDNAVERLGFALFGLTAGVCEEALYRGFLIRYLHDGAPALPVLLALAISSLTFGLGHIYQGAPNVLRISLGGVAFGLVFLLSGSLIPAIVLHILIDLQIPFILRPLPGESGPAENGVPGLL